jgi:hypothetical protein
MKVPQYLYWFLLSILVTSPGPHAQTTTDTAPKPTIDELRSLPYVGTTANSGDKTGVVVNSRYAADGYNFYSDRFHDTAALITNDGRVLHSWARPNSSSWGDAEILPDGSLMVIETWDPTKQKDYPKEKGFPSRIVKLSAASTVEFTSAIPAHHDIQRSSDGTFLTLTERPRRINAVSKQNRTIDNGIARFDRRGKLLKEISLYAAVSRSANVTLKPVKPNDRGLIDLFHTNSIQELGEIARVSRPADPLYDPGNILFCSRHQDLVGIVSPRGRLLWSWGQNDLSGPHAARLLPSGRVLLFDNGLGRGASRVLEVDPHTNHIEWTYQASPPQDFYSPTAGFSQRLPNGNTLITNSATYSAFEVTPESRIVWRFVNPLKSFVYRFQRLPASYFEPSFARSLQ